MKKLISAIIMGILLVSGCASNDAPSASTEYSPTAATSTAAESTTSVVTTASATTATTTATTTTTAPEAIEPPEPETIDDFRNAEWGMSKAEVREILGAPNMATEAVLAYEDLTVNGHDGASAALSFDANDMLWQGFYMIPVSYKNDSLYATSYEDFVDAMSEKYGTPTTDTIIWNSDLFKDSPEDYGLALELGIMYYAAQWETERSSIGLVLTSDDYGSAIFLISYQTKVFDPIEIEIDDGL